MCTILFNNYEKFSWCLVTYCGVHVRAFYEKYLNTLKCKTTFKIGFIILHPDHRGDNINVIFGLWVMWIWFNIWTVDMKMIGFI